MQTSSDVCEETKINVSSAHSLHAALYLLKLQETGRKQEKGTVW